MPTNPILPPIRRLRRRARRRRTNPFDDRVGRPLLVHCSHHKVGTVWIWRVLWALAAPYALKVQVCLGEPVEADTDVALFRASRLFDRRLVGGRALRGSHLIRDPRDIVVSGYHYHLWTREPWAQEPDPRWGGRSYQQYLTSVPKDVGLLAEIERCASTVFADMGAWDYTQPDFLELRYEDLMAGEEEGFSRLFGFYGLNDAATAVGLDAVRRLSIHSGSAPGTARAERHHVRSGASGQWRAEFGPDHVARFKALTGDLLVRLGYEPDTAWTL